MAYSTSSDIASEFKNITFDSNTSLTDTEVTEFIVQTDAIIDGYLNNKYSVPITGSTALSIVKRISIGLTVRRIIPILRVRTGVENLEQDTQSVMDDAQKLLDDIIAGKIELTDASKASSSHGFKSYSYDNSLEYKFKREEDQW